MFVLRREDKDYGEPKVVHGTIEEATVEAKRLCEVHAKELPRFWIYDLKPVIGFKAELKVKSIATLLMV